MTGVSAIMNKPHFVEACIVSAHLNHLVDSPQRTCTRSPDGLLEEGCHRAG